MFHVGASRDYFSILPFSLDRAMGAASCARMASHARGKGALASFHGWKLESVGIKLASNHGDDMDDLCR